MTQIRIPIKQRVSLHDPYTNKDNRYLFYVNVKDISDTFMKWMEINARDQNVLSNVARAIAASLMEGSKRFYLRNRGIRLAVKNIQFEEDRSTGVPFTTAILTLDDENLHGVIDGAHTLKIVRKHALRAKTDEFVTFDVLQGETSIADIEAGLNTSVAIDQRSLVNARGDFEVIKELVKDQPWEKNIEYFDNYGIAPENNVQNPLDVRMLISILNIVNKDIYHDGVRCPKTSYDDKKAVLDAFVSEVKDRTAHAKYIPMKPIIGDYARLCDQIYTDTNAFLVELAGTTRGKELFSNTFLTTKCRRAHTLFNKQEFGNQSILGAVYPIFASMRALLTKTKDGYAWMTDPFTFWRLHKEKIFKILHDNLKDSPKSINVLGKRRQLWEAIYKEVDYQRIKTTRA